MPELQHDLEVVRTGTAITIPMGVTELQAAAHLIRLHEQSEKETDVREVIEGALPADGALAMAKAYKRLFGFANNVDMIVQGMFGPQKKRTTSMSVETGPGETTQIAWGAFSVPQIEGNLQCGVSPSGRMLNFMINGTVKQKHLGLVKQLADETRKIVREESIYRGKSVRLSVGEDGQPDLNAIKFIDVRNVKREQLILNADVRAALDINVFVRLEHTASVEAAKLPLKTGIMLAGPYGTGKTMTANTIAKVANDNGWTFILVSRVGALAAAMEIARNYAPCVLFAEDLDRVMSGEDRSVGMDDILNTIDGVESKKDNQVMVVMSTNHLEQIPRVMLRPGRIDTVIEYGHPDRDSTEKLIRVYAKGDLPSDAPLAQSIDALTGNTSAFIAEVVQKSKLAAIMAGSMSIADEHIATAALSMEGHKRLLEQAATSTEGPLDKLEIGIGHVVKRQVDDALASIKERLDVS